MNIKLFQIFCKSKILWKFYEARDRFFRRKSKIVLMQCVPVRIPNSNSNNPNFFQTSQKFLHFPFFRDGNISVLKVEKVRVVRHSVFPNSKFQILDGAKFPMHHKNLQRKFMIYEFENLNRTRRKTLSSQSSLLI
jgi:hypothetical protein